MNEPDFPFFLEAPPVTSLLLRLQSAQKILLHLSSGLDNRNNQFTSKPFDKLECYWPIGSTICRIILEYLLKYDILPLDVG